MPKPIPIIGGSFGDFGAASAKRVITPQPKKIDAWMNMNSRLPQRLVGSQVLEVAPSFRAEVAAQQAAMPSPEPRIGDQETVYDVIPIDFSIARTDMLFFGRWNLFNLIYATAAGGTTPILFIRVGKIDKARIPFTAGVSIRGMQTDRFYLTNSITGTETGYLFVAYSKKVEDLEVT